MDRKELLDSIAAVAEGVKREYSKESKKIPETDKECEIMMKLSDKIIETILNNNLIEDDMRGWASIIMLAMGRATAVILSGLDHVHATGFMSADIMYEKIVLPASLGIVREYTEKEDKKESQEEDNNGTKGS